MKNSKSKSKTLRIGVTFDFNESCGYFLKADMAGALVSKGVQIVPFIYQATDLGEILKTLDGLLIPGGLGDVDPKHYGQKRKFENVKIIRERCDFEFRLLDAYLPMQKPLLSICWGFQLLNVYHGGSLYQDLQYQRKSSIRHEQTEPKHKPTHEVLLRQNGSAAKLFKKARLKVNSTHHQGIDRLAPTLSAEGWSRDELVECFVDLHHPFSLGVQWHPERLKDDVVIPSFLKACQRLRS